MDCLPASWKIHVTSYFEGSIRYRHIKVWVPKDSHFRQRHSIRRNSIQGIAPRNGSKHHRKFLYTPQANPVERANKIVKTMIAQFCHQNQRKWNAEFRN